MIMFNVYRYKFSRVFGAKEISLASPRMLVKIHYGCLYCCTNIDGRRKADQQCRWKKSVEKQVKIDETVKHYNAKNDTTYIHPEHWTTDLTKITK